MKYRIITDKNCIDRKQWENYVFNHPQGNIFQTPQMFSVYESTVNYQPVILACYDDESLVGILLAVLQKEYRGLLGKLSSRSIVWGGPLTDSEDITKKLLLQYNEMVGGRAVFTQIRNFHFYYPKQKKAFEMHGFSYEQHLNILVDLTIGADQFWKDIKRNRKDGINKAKKHGFTFEVVDSLEYLESFYFLLEGAYKKIKLPYADKSFFISLNSYAQEYLKWFIFKKDNVPIIVLVALVFKGTIYAFYIGTTKDDAILNLRPVDLFYYEVMRWGIDNGYKMFDWMGAGNPNKEYGVRKFKIQYGGELIEMGRFEKVHQPLIMKLSKIGFWCWQKIRI